jgi:hypothetical protein
MYRKYRGTTVTMNTEIPNILLKSQKNWQPCNNGICISSGSLLIILFHWWHLIIGAEESNTTLLCLNEAQQGTICKNLNVSLI